MPDSSSLTRLKRRLEQLEQPHGTRAAERFTSGCVRLDARLGGGLSRTALHEICAQDANNHAAATGFALMLCARAAKGKPVLWVREDAGERWHGGLYAPGMIELGINPEQIIMVQAPDTLSALRAGADITGCMELGAVVIEPFGAAAALDLTASRRLVLACEKSGVTALVLRDGASGFASAAATRWQVASAPSALLPGEAPGQTRLLVELLRHRGGVAPFGMILEWDRDGQLFCEPALSGAVPSPAERGQVAA